MTPDEMDCFATDEIICPYCGAEQTDSWEIFDKAFISDTQMWCDTCEREFRVSQTISVAYTTEPMEGWR